MTEKGVKGDSGKRRWRFFPWAELGEVADVLDKGATRYAPDNWKKVADAEGRYFDAAMRHLIDGYASGEYIDDPAKGGDGESHLAHAVCCLLFLMWFGNKNGKRSPFDYPAEQLSTTERPCGTQINQTQCAVAEFAIRDRLRNNNKETSRERYDI